MNFTLDSPTGIAVLVWIVSVISTDQYYPDVRMRKVIEKGGATND